MPLVLKNCGKKKNICVSTVTFIKRRKSPASSALEARTQQKNRKEIFAEK